MTHGVGRKMYTDYEIICMVRIAFLALLSSELLSSITLSVHTRGPEELFEAAQGPGRSVYRERYERYMLMRRPTFPHSSCARLLSGDDTRTLKSFGIS